MSVIVSNMFKISLLVLAAIFHVIAGVPYLSHHQYLRETQTAPSQLLKAFGLSSPGVRRWHSEPPQYMLDLYSEVADINGVSRGQPAPYGAQVIRAFNENEAPEDNSFTFELNGLDEQENLIEAELRVYHNRLDKFHRDKLVDSVYKLEVYAENGVESSLVDIQYVSAHGSGWRLFRVGSALLRDQVLSSTVSFTIVATNMAGDPLPIHLHHEGTRQSLLVLFNTNDGTITPKITKEAWKKKGHESSSMNRVRRSVEEANEPISPVSGCERQDMYVDFESIGWSDWIVYPKGYNAYHCSGMCEFPLGQDQNPTNHATVQSIIHHSGDFPQVQRPCCTPSQYANLSLLYYDSDENVVLKLYDQMVAVECGCH
ncbi:unnamed protein product, partial [Meganyctiphanes norvegica]